MSFVLEHITKSYGTVRALDGVSFRTSEGEIFGLIGPDGAGKSTLFRILATLLFAEEGQASVAGYDVRKEFLEIRKIIGYMAGRFSLYHDLTVKENLEFYATVFGTTIKRNYELIKNIYTHIEPFSDRLAGKLSGGMKQKLALSCALIHRPKVLILDEPTTGVDAVSRKEFWELLEEIRGQGITILVSTPYMDEASLCDRVGLIQKGKLLATSDPALVSMREGTRLFSFRCDAKMYDFLDLFRQTGSTVEAWLSGDEIHVSVDSLTDLEKLNKKVANLKVPGLIWEERKPGVEDCFMQLMSLNP